MIAKAFSPYRVVKSSRSWERRRKRGQRRQSRAGMSYSGGAGNERAMTGRAVWPAADQQVINRHVLKSSRSWKCRGNAARPGSPGQD